MLEVNIPQLLISRILCALSISCLSSNAFAANVDRHAQKIAKQVNHKVGKISVVLPADIPCRAWTPSHGQVTMVLLCIHGLGLNSKSYENFGLQMAKLGVATYAIDVRGFGNWMKREGEEQIDFEACLSDIEKVLKALHTGYPHLPVYLLGESMGGAIALRVTAIHPELVDGLISAVPSGDRFHKTRNQLRVALHLVTGGKNKPMDVGTKVIEQATDDPSVREQWKGDPLNRMKLTPKELMQFQRFMNENHDIAPQIDQKPVLVICGFKDKLVKPQGTIELFNEITTPDKMLIVLGSGEHLIFEEGQFSDQASWVLMGWLKNHNNNHRSTLMHKAVTVQP